MASSAEEPHNTAPAPANAEQQQQQQQQQKQQEQQQQQQSQPPHQFTAVNNAPPTPAPAAAPTAPMSGVSTSTSASQPSLPTSLFGGPSNLLTPPPGGAATRPSGSPEAQGASVMGEEGWANRAESADLAGNGQKRKRTPEEMDRDNRAVSPTTQTQRHHLAAHEAALGGVGGVGGVSSVGLGGLTPVHHLTGQEPYKLEDTTPHFGPDDSHFRAPHDNSPQPGGEKRRKRVFSNRTKTGCITCRRRKKKCDEGKPECSNCKRGGFVCEGYSGKVSWQKPPGKGSNGPAGTLSLLPAKDHEGTASPTPMQRPIHTTTMAYTVATTDDSTRPADDRFSAPALDAANYAASTQPATAPSVTSTIASEPRRVSFSHPIPPSIPTQRIRSEKDKMINSELYHASHPDLVREREACKAACWRYNNAVSNPTLGVSAAERGRLLLEILRPGKNWEIVNTGGAGINGAGVTYVSDNGYSSDIQDVTVDAPFTCSYGYNIKLGKNVYIEFGCTILDSCQVEIKARTILSPNVSIYSATHPIDPRKRNGSRGPEMAKRVVIEEDCWLGGNVIVLGGITIGKGSVVGAGSVVTRDVPPFTVVAGNPARVIRGIYQNGTDM